MWDEKMQDENLQDENLGTKKWQMKMCQTKKCPDTITTITTTIQTITTCNNSIQTILSPSYHPTWADCSYPPKIEMICFRGVEPLDFLWLRLRLRLRAKSCGSGWLRLRLRLRQSHLSIRLKYTYLFCFGSGKAFAWPERELLASCWAQNEQPNAKRIYVPPGLMPGSNANECWAGWWARRTWYRGGSVSGLRCSYAYAENDLLRPQGPIHHKICLRQRRPISNWNDSGSEGPVRPYRALSISSLKGYKTEWRGLRLSAEGPFPCLHT